MAEKVCHTLRIKLRTIQFTFGRLSSQSLNVDDDGCVAGNIKSVMVHEAPSSTSIVLLATTQVPATQLNSTAQHTATNMQRTRHACFV